MEATQMRQRRLLAVGVGALLLVGMVAGVDVSGAVAPVENPLDVGAQDDAGEEEAEDEEEEEDPVNVSQVHVPAREAIAIAENETNGTVVGLELTTVAPNELGAENETETEEAAENETTDENEVLAWEVELVAQDGTEKEVLIDATDGSILGVLTESAEQEDAELAEDEGTEQTDADRGNETEDTDTATESGELHRAPGVIPSRILYE